MTGRDNFFRRLLLLEIEFEDRIQNVIRRQRLIVKLPRRELGRGPLLNNRAGNNLVFLIVMTRESINLGFENVADHR
jgi:hypothetical protein